MAKFDVEAARKAGYSDDEILQELSKSSKFDVNRGLQAGYSKAELVEHLSRAVTPPQAAPEEPGMMENIGKGARALWEKVNPVEGAKGLYQAATHPGETISGIAEAHKRVYGEGEKALKRGDYIGGAAAALGSAVPLLGPDIYQSYRNLEAGNQAEALGGLGGTLLGLVTLPQRVSKLGSRWAGVPGMDALAPQQRAGVEMLRDRGVRMTAATQGGGDLPWAAETLASVSPAGAYLAPRMARMTEGDLSRVAKELGQETLPQNYTPITAGESVMDALKKRAGRQEGYAGKHYQVLDDAAKDPAYVRSVQQGVDPKTQQPIMADVAIPVDTEPFRAAAKELYDHMKLSSSLQRHSSNAWSTLNELMQQPRHIPAALAEEMLGLIKGDARAAKGLDAGRLKFLVSKFQPVVDDALRQADPTLAKAVEKGRGWTAKQKETERISQQVTGVSKQSSEQAMLREPEPVNVYQRLTQEGDKRARLLERLQKTTPKELPKLGRAYVEDVLQSWRDTGESMPTQGVAQKMWNDWHALGDEAKKKMFPTPMVKQNWDEFFDGVRQIARNPNPSGTAKTGASLMQFGAAGKAWESGHPVMAVISGLGPSAIAAMMYTPRGAAILRKGFRIPAGDIAKAAAWSNQVGNMAAELSDEEKIRKLFETTGTKMLPYEYGPGAR